MPLFLCLCRLPFISVLLFSEPNSLFLLHIFQLAEKLSLPGKQEVSSIIEQAGRKIIPPTVAVSFNIFRSQTLLT